MILLKSALVILMINLKKYRNCFMATLSAVAFFSACSDDSSSSVNEEFSGLHINALVRNLRVFLSESMNSKFYVRDRIVTI